MIKKINQISEQGFLLDFGSEISKEINQSVINIFYYICNQIQKDNFLDLKNCTPSYNKILLQFNPAKKNKNEIFNFINTINITKIKSRISHEEIEIPICYDEEFALDIHSVSKKTNVDENIIIKTHLSTNFFVYMIGFMPGLPFMGNLDQTILIPRKLSPRVEVPSGSVAIVDNLCVIYPNISPGGWNIIGRTPQIIFNKNSHHPNLLRAGFKVKFKKISKQQFKKFAKNNET